MFGNTGILLLGYLFLKFVMGEAVLFWWTLCVSVCVIWRQVTLLVEVTETLVCYFTRDRFGFMKLFNEFVRCDPLHLTWNQENSFRS